MNTHIYEPTLIAIEGGPGGGKSTCMTAFCEKLEEIGIIPLIVPEAATILINKGIKPASIGNVAFQAEVIRLHLANEEKAIRKGRMLARKYHRRVVILCDRGLLGGAGYLDHVSAEESLREFDGLLRPFGLDVETARSRYAGVIHLVTAADGAEEYYTLRNNAARKETREQARARDKRTQRAYLGHGHLAVVPNVDRNGVRISFQAKLRAALRELFRILGYPVPTEIEKKYTVVDFDLTGIPHEVIDIEQTYLIPASRRLSERIRARRWLDLPSYYHTTKQAVKGSSKRIEREHLVLLKQYEELKKRADPQKMPILKDRHCFIWEHQYFELDIFKGRLSGLVLLEREKTLQNDSTKLPPFVKIGKDVSNDEKYKNASLASIK